jgi:hypothetical protein
MGLYRVDLGLAGKPKLRARLEALASDAGVSVDELHAAIVAAGIKTSRSGVGRWRRRYQPGVGLLARVIAAVLKLPPSRLRELAVRLGVSLNRDNKASRS